MATKLTEIGQLRVKSFEAISAVRQKIAQVSLLSGFSGVDATRLAITVSEICRKLLSHKNKNWVGVHLYGSKTIDGIGLSFPALDSVKQILGGVNYFDNIKDVEGSVNGGLIVLKEVRGKRQPLDQNKLDQIKKLLTLISREELMGELKTKNEELKNHQINLEYKVKERTASLSKANDELDLARATAEEASKSKASFLAAMSHEIRTPMNGVVGMVDLLQQTTLDSEQKHMLQTIKDSGNSLLTIINDILDFSKIEAGKLELEEIPLSIIDVLEGSAQTIAPNANKQNVRLITFVDPTIPDEIIGDPVRLRQILINLGGNAIKFSENGQVVLKAQKLECDTKTRIRFSVIDTGIGISKENQKSLFKEFSQADVSTTRKFGGTGLGLSICQRLTEMLGGEIGVISEIGAGSEFFVVLDFENVEKAKAKNKTNALKGKKVLLINPVDEEREALSAYLEQWKANVLPVADFDAGWKAALKKKFDVVIISGDRDAEGAFNFRKRLLDANVKKQPSFVLGRDPRKINDKLKNVDGVVYLNTNPVQRVHFLSMVALALGGKGPETHKEKVEISVPKGRAPTVEEALEMDRLILLAEDNLTNQDVIRRQLNILGYACEIADDGAQALEMWGQKKYAALLTDCHMPEMDGFELTQAIREGDIGPRTPIIAITANALHGEAARCIAMGMDDYLSKPVNMKKLAETLNTWVGPGGIDARLEKEVNIKITKENKKNGLDSKITVIDENVLMEMFDDEDTCKEILREFIEPAQENVDELITAAHDGSAEGVKDSAHKLKSSSRSIGADSLADTCETLEAAGSNDDWEVINKFAKTLAPLFDDVKNYITHL